MKKNKKNYINTILMIVLSFISLIIIPIILVDIVMPLVTSRPNLNRMENDFQVNRNELYAVVEYLRESGYAMIGISRSDMESNEFAGVKMYTGLETGHVLVSDEEVAESIRILFCQGYRVIGKRGEGIFFMRWSTRERGRGIVYSINRTTPDESMITFLTELEPLTEDGWYFYVDDFNEWRRQNNR